MIWVSELNENEFDRRIQFCPYFTEQVILNPNIFYYTYFSDQRTFMLNGEGNTQNCRYWSDINSHLFRAIVVGLFFIQGSIYGIICLELFEEDTADNRITKILENDDNLMSSEFTFQHDVVSLQYLDEQFPGQWNRGFADLT